jgi:hypothetical protein
MNGKIRFQEERSHKFENGGPLLSDLVGQHSQICGIALLESGSCHSFVFRLSQASSFERNPEWFWPKYRTFHSQ